MSGRFDSYTVTELTTSACNPAVPVQRFMSRITPIVLITGASSGIGKAIAQDLDKAGMRLVLTARSQDKLNELAASLQQAKVFAGAITDPGIPQNLLDTALETFGQLDLVINNAGVMTVGAIEDVDIEAICEMVRLNVESVYRMAYTALRHFKKTGSGFLINTSSIAGLKTAPQYGAYNGTKYAIEAFSELPLKRSTSTLEYRLIKNFAATYL